MLTIEEESPTIVLHCEHWNTTGEGNSFEGVGVSVTAELSTISMETFSGGARSAAIIFGHSPAGISCKITNLIMRKINV